MKTFFKLEVLYIYYYFSDPVTKLSCPPPPTTTHIFVVLLLVHCVQEIFPIKGYLARTVAA